SSTKSAWRGPTPSCDRHIWKIAGSGLAAPTSHETTTTSNHRASWRSARMRAMTSGTPFERNAVRPPVRRNDSARRHTSSLYSVHDAMSASTNLAVMASRLEGTDEGPRVSKARRQYSAAGSPASYRERCCQYASRNTFGGTPICDATDSHQSLGCG